MSNTFVTPRVVTTISQSRLNYNDSITSLLQNFASTGAPSAASVNLEGVTGLKTGMFWYKSGSTTSDGQGRVFIYDGSSFTRDGIGTYQMSSVSEANSAASAGRIEYGDLILVGTNDLYLVNSAETGIVKIGEAATTLSGLTASQFVRSDIDATASGNVRFTSNNFVTIPIGTTAQRPVGTAAQPGQIRFNTQLSVYESYFGTAWRNLSGITEVVSNSSNFSANVVFASANGAVLYSNNNLTFNPSTGTLSSTIFNSTSDIRLKENIKEIPDALEKLDLLSGYLFNFIGQTNESAGLIAQELQEVLPQCVNEVNDVLQVNYAGALALVLQGFKEYRHYIESRLDYIESRLDER
jgi:hypothetical protein